MNLKTIIKLLILGTLLTSCSQQGDIRNSKSSSSINPKTSAENLNHDNKAISTATDMTSKSSTSTLVNLVFKPLQMEPLTEGIPNKNWQLLKEIPFGEINQQKIELSIYQEPKKVEDLYIVKHASIKFQNKIYLINDLISNDLSETPIAEHSTMYLLQHTFSNRDNQLFLLGGIEVFANGPGRVAYIIYDSMKNKWFMFEDWGKPLFIDLDSDGIDEFVIQFEGLHLQYPDVTVYRWNKGIIEVSTSVKTAVLGSSVGNYNYAILGNDKKISIGDNRTEKPGDQYIYDNGVLIKQ